MKSSAQQSKRSSTKKNSKVDVSRNGSIYFAIGLALMMFLTYNTINYKSYDTSLIDIGKLDLEADLIEETPLIVQIMPPPPPPKPAKDFEVFEDDDKIEETLVAPTDTSQEEEIEIEDIELVEIPSNRLCRKYAKP